MKIHTQAELTANIETGEILEIVAAGVFALTLFGSVSPRIVIGDGVQLSIEAWGSSAPSIEARGSSAPSIVAWESSAPRIVAWGSSAPRIVARESSAPRIVAWESSAPSIVAWGSSAPRIEARESSAPSIEAWGSSAPRIVAWESSAPSIEARESSAPSIEAWGSSAPSIEARESSAPRIEARESSAPRIVARESSAPRIEAWESSAPSIEAWESSAPSIVAWGSSAPRIVARESSAPSIVARESSAPRIEARESSAPRIEAWESSAAFMDARAYSRVLIRGTVLVNATPNVSVVAHGKGWKVEGVEPKVVDISTPTAWCDYYGVVVNGDVAMLYKAVNDDYRSPRGQSYAPGTIPVAADWDGGKAECGGGLHYSPSPAMAREFHPSAKRYLACPVALADISVHPDGAYPQKIKARGCCAPTYEVDEDAEPTQAVK